MYWNNLGFVHFCRIILETDANTIAGKVATNAVDGSVPFSEQVIILSILSQYFRLHMSHDCCDLLCADDISGTSHS